MVPVAFTSLPRQGNGLSLFGFVAEENYFAAPTCLYERPEARSMVNDLP